MSQRVIELKRNTWLVELPIGRVAVIIKHWLQETDIVIPLFQLNELTIRLTFERMSIFLVRLAILLVLSSWCFVTQYTCYTCTSQLGVFN